nr:PP2C family serine/threonine-protein phosphatase [Brevibacterium daeguense]
MLRSAARSNTGLVRKNNQDSGYAGANFLLVADGMGGHAGGDVASAIAVARLAELDRPDQGQDTLDVLRSTILDANERIANCVIEQPELAGMGTTVTALLRTGNRLALAHIGDSRAYLVRDGEVTLVTHDHTFVQMLVDEGRITEEEAESHPQRSVVMRVLGDVGASPELDLSLRDTRIGDRWMLCSDGLTGFAASADIRETLTSIADPDACCERLVDLALAGGGADNITVVIGDVVEADESVLSGAAALGEEVGSVRINPQYSMLGRSEVPTEAVPTGPLDVVTASDEADTAELTTAADAAAEPRARTRRGDRAEHRERSRRAEDAEQVDTQPLPPGYHGRTTDASGADTAAAGAAGATATTTAPGERTSADHASATGRTAQEDYDDEFGGWGEEPTPRRRRPIVTLVITLLVLGAIALAGVISWNFIRSQYYVGAETGVVAIYRGIPQTFGPIDLGTLEETTDVQVDQLSTFSQKRLEETIPAGSREAAADVVTTLRQEAESNARAADLQGGAADATRSPDPAPPAPESGERPTPDEQSLRAPAAGAEARR